MSSLDADNGLQILGRGVKELVRAVRVLRHLSIEDFDLPLLKIVVVGDQSTGKSSLIEGMSEISGSVYNQDQTISIGNTVVLSWNRQGDPRFHLS